MLAKLQLFKSLVVPVLEYASPVWSPFAKKDTQKLDMDYETRLRVLGLVSLEKRKRIKDLVTCYKYTNGFINVDTHHFSCTCSLSKNQIQSRPEITDSVLPNCFKFSLAVLYQHKILFLILLFLLRILFCLKNICLCITTLAINSVHYMLY